MSPCPDSNNARLGKGSVNCKKDSVIDVELSQHLDWLNAVLSFVKLCVFNSSVKLLDKLAICL